MKEAGGLRAWTCVAVNQISDRGATALADALKLNSTLRVVVLDSK